MTSFGRARCVALCAFAVLLMLALLSPIAVPTWAQDKYPSQAIKLIVPFSAGGLPDTVARIVAPGLQERLKQPIVVENRPGSGGSVAALALMAAPADGYQLIVTDNSFLSINPFIYKQLSYQPHDFMTVALLAHAPLFLAVHPKLPVKTMQAFIDYARANPGKINYGSSGIGTAHHLSMEAIKAQLTLDMSHVPFRGTGQSVPALLGGHVDALFSAYPSLSGALESKQVTLIAANSARRSPQVPDVPAVSEFIPGFDFASRIGIFARAGTPDAIVRRIAEQAIAVTKESDAAQHLMVVGAEPAGAGPAEFNEVLQDEIARVAATVKAAGIEPQ
jgi:tripartite-type tricarboxylate transporter receptor subunit TctC